MDWRQGRRSDNVEDRRGGGGGRLSLGAVAIVVVVSLLLGKNPLEMLGLVEQATQAVPQQPAPGTADANDPRVDFVRAILGETEDVWTPLFAASGQRYEDPHLVLYSGSIQSGCGGASASSGPFYCPQDHKVYLDLSFFDQMRARLGGGGDFAQAYVIAHEVGHHVQTLLGLAPQTAHERGAAGSSVRRELQADCFAGVWAYHAQQRHHWLQDGDVASALNTATAIGDDRLQKQSQGYTVPESFTHGTSAQRVRWFRTGFESGDPQRCDTFSATQL